LLVLISYDYNSDNKKNENTIILHARTSAERAKKASRRAQGLLLTAANKTRKLRDLASIKRLKEIGTGIGAVGQGIKEVGRQSIGAVGSVGKAGIGAVGLVGKAGIGAVGSVGKAGIGAVGTGIGIIAKKTKETNEATANKLFERLKTLKNQLKDKNLKKLNSEVSSYMI
jgi:hypothetical protein